MKIKKFNVEVDLKKLENYLRNEYLENKNMTSWLPERLHDFKKEDDGLIDFLVITNDSLKYRKEYF